MVSRQLDFRYHLSAKFHLAGTQGSTMAGATQPTEIETKQLPQRIETKTTGHHRVPFKMTLKKP